MIIIEENSLSRPNPTLITGFSCANFCYLSLNSSLFKDLLPDFSSFVVLGDFVFFISNKTCDIEPRRVKSDFLCQELEESTDLLFFKIIPEVGCSKAISRLSPMYWKGWFSVTTIWLLVMPRLPV